MNNKKTIFQRIIIGAKKGYLTPTLPYSILGLQKNPLIRIMRVLGGVSTICLISHKLEILGSGLLYKIALCFCTLLSFIFTFYLLYINYHRVKYMIKTFKSSKLDVHKSPLNK